MLFGKLILNIFIAPLTIAKVSARVYGKTAEKRRKWWPYAIPSFGLFFLFILFHILEVVAIEGCWAIAWFWYLGFVCQITAVRIKTREIYGILGNASEDFFAAMVLYPNVAMQLDLTTEDLAEEDYDGETKKDPEKALPENGKPKENTNYAYENNE